MTPRKLERRMALIERWVRRPVGDGAEVWRLATEVSLPADLEVRLAQAILGNRRAGRGRPNKAVVWARDVLGY